MELFEEKLIRGSVHPYIGMEAIAVGVCAALGPDDYITSTHRGHGHCVAKGLDLKPDDGRDHRPRGRLLPRARRQHAHHRDRAGDARRGRDRRRLVRDRRRRRARPAPAGQATPSSSASSATAPRTRGSCTRPATSAAVLDAQVVFVCENNEWAISTPASASTKVVEHRRPRRRLRLPRRDRGRQRRRSRCAPRPTRRVARARAGEGPTLIEAKSYRDHRRTRPRPRPTCALPRSSMRGGRATRSCVSRASSPRTGSRARRLEEIEEQARARRRRCRRVRARLAAARSGGGGRGRLRAERVEHASGQLS